MKTGNYKGCLLTYRIILGVCSRILMAYTFRCKVPRPVHPEQDIQFEEIFHLI